MNKSFSEWMSQEIDRRGWYQSDLARASGLSDAAISNLLSKSRSPGPEACTAIATAFKIPPETVFIIAGLLPDQPDSDPQSQELLYIYQSSPQEIKDDILEFARYRTRDQK